MGTAQQMEMLHPDYSARRYVASLPPLLLVPLCTLRRLRVLASMFTFPPSLAAARTWHQPPLGRLGAFFLFTGCWQRSDVCCCHVATEYEPS